MGPLSLWVVAALLAVPSGHRQGVASQLAPVDDRIHSASLSPPEQQQQKQQQEQQRQQKQQQKQEHQLSSSSSSSASVASSSTTPVQKEGGSSFFSHHDASAYEGLFTRVAAQNVVSAMASGGPVCMSHDIWIVLSDSMTAAYEGAESSMGNLHNGTANGPDKIILLSTLLLLSLVLLIGGTRIMNVALTLIVFMVGFVFTFGLVDALTYKVHGEIAFTMCVLPFVLALLLGVILAVLVGCCVSRLSWLPFFALGLSLGVVGAYFLRGVLVTANPQLELQPPFRYGYWIGTGVVAILCGLIATCLRQLFYVATCIAVGAFAFATAVSGLVVAAGGSPIAFGSYIALIVGAAGVGAACQVYFSRKPPPEIASSSSMKGGGSDALKESMIIGA